MDVEAIAFVRAKLAALRGYMSARTYSAISDALNTIRNEHDSLKTTNGRCAAENDTLRSQVESLGVEIKNLTSQLEAKSIVEVNKEIEVAIENLVTENSDLKCPETAATEVVVAIESQ